MEGWKKNINGTCLQENGVVNVAEKEFIGIVDRELDEIIYSPVCTLCTHYHRGKEEHTCKAFPYGIPDDIWSGDNEHKRPYAGDNGILFERV